MISSKRLHNYDLPEHLKMDERHYKIVRDEITSYIDENNYINILMILRDLLLKDSEDHLIGEGTPMPYRLATAQILDTAINQFLKEQPNDD